MTSDPQHRPDRTPADPAFETMAAPAAAPDRAFETMAAPAAAPDRAFETMAAPAAASGPTPGSPRHAAPEPPGFETMAAPVAAGPGRTYGAPGTVVAPVEAPTVVIARPAPPRAVRRPSAVGALAGTAAIGALVAVTLGVYGRFHLPQPAAVNVAGFSGPGEVKSWLTTLAFVLGLVQLGSALVMWGRIPRVAPPSWIGGLHRWSGRVAVIATVPVAVHCLYVLGFAYDEPRVLVHSLLGCLFYGVFVTKMLVLSRDDRVPGWVMPVAGGVTFTALTGLWLTSAVWFFATTGIHL
jgi:hypothetical protein